MKMAHFYIPLAIQCKACQRPFVDVIKLIPDCKQSICAKCYEMIKEDAAREDSEYKCPACKERHLWEGEFADDFEHLVRELKRQKDICLHLESSAGKPLSQKAVQLQESCETLVNKLHKLESFDGQEEIKARCESLEQTMSEAVQKAVDVLNRFEQENLKRIKEYEKISLQSYAARNHRGINAEVDKLTREIANFAGGSLHEYIQNIGQISDDWELDRALKQAKEYIDQVEDLHSYFQDDLIEDHSLVFIVNEQFEKSSLVGHFEELPWEPRSMRRRAEDYERRGLDLCFKNEFKQGIELLEKAVDTRRKSNNSDLELATTSHRIGLSILELEKFKKASEFFRKSLEIFKRVHSDQPDHSDIANSLHYLGLTDSQMRESIELIRCYHESLKTRRAISQSHTDNPGMSDVWNELGIAQVDLDRYLKEMSNFLEERKWRLDRQKWNRKAVRR